MIRAGLIFLLCVTGFSSFLANVVHDLVYPTTPGQFRIIKPEIIWIFHTIVLAIVSLPAVLVMMIAAWRRFRFPIVIGLVAITLIVVGLSALNFMDMAMSSYETKRAQQWSAVTFGAVALASLIAGFFLSYILLRRTRIMQPLLDPARLLSSAPAP